MVVAVARGLSGVGFLGQLSRRHFNPDELPTVRSDSHNNEDADEGNASETTPYAHIVAAIQQACQAAYNLAIEDVESVNREFDEAKKDVDACSSAVAVAKDTLQDAEGALAVSIEYRSVTWSLLSEARFKRYIAHRALETANAQAEWGYAHTSPDTSHNHWKPWQLTQAERNATSHDGSGRSNEDGQAWLVEALHCSTESCLHSGAALETGAAS